MKQRETDIEKLSEGMAQNGINRISLDEFIVNVPEESDYEEYQSLFNDWRTRMENCENELIKYKSYYQKLWENMFSELKRIPQEDCSIVRMNDNMLDLEKRVLKALNGNDKCITVKELIEYANFKEINIMSAKLKPDYVKLIKAHLFGVEASNEIIVDWKKLMCGDYKNEELKTIIRYLNDKYRARLGMQKGRKEELTNTIAVYLNDNLNLFNVDTENEIIHI